MLLDNCLAKLTNHTSVEVQELTKFRMILFTHQCPNCHKNQRLELEQLGTEISCRHCHRLCTAVDSDIESLAMYDSIKDHAELADVDNFSDQVFRPR